jgi:hypothetical protein
MKSLFVVVVAFGAGSLFAGPLDKNAASKATGDMIGRPAPMRAAMAPYSAAPSATAPSNANRSFSYSPAPAAAPAPAPRTTAPVPRPPVQAAPVAPVRRYSYQPQAVAPRYYGNVQSAQPGYLRVDKKILGY